MLFSIMMYDEPNSAALRDERRAEHLDYLKAFDDQTLFAGPFTTDDESADLGSLRLIDLPDRRAAEKHVADEPYVIGGIQKRWEIHRWRGSVPYTWRDCPRKEGNIQAIFYGLDHPGCVLYGILIGVLVVVIRVWGGMPEGVMYAILLGNAASPLIDNWIQPRVYGTTGNQS